MMMPDLTSNVKQVSTYQYVATSGKFQIPRMRTIASIPKIALGVSAITKSCDTTEYITVYYGVNGASPTTSLGTLKSSPYPTALPFVSGLGLAFYTIQFAVDLRRDAGTNTLSPELETLTFFWKPRPTILYQWSFRIKTNDSRAEKDMDDWETLISKVPLLTFYPSGNKASDSHKVEVINLPLSYHHDEMSEREGFIEVTLSEVYRG